MCISPNTLATGEQVACHECWQCRATKVNDWVGRCIAESKTVVGAHAVTLTYGRKERGENGDWKSTQYGEVDHPSAAVLTYSDVQKYFKKPRSGDRDPNKRYPLRYFVTGEYGSRKGRAHWHIIIFWLKRVPPHVLGERFDEKHWEHGLSFWTAPSYEDFRYNTKYILKDMGAAERQGHLSMSKKPPLGAEYFRRLAKDYAKQGLAPQNSFYTFPEAVRKNGERHQFKLSGKSEELFAQAFWEEWERLYPGRWWPTSPWLDEIEDRLSPWNGTFVTGPDGSIDWGNPFNRPMPQLGPLRAYTGATGELKIESTPDKRRTPFVEVSSGVPHDGNAWFWVEHKGKWIWLNGAVERRTGSDKLVSW